MTTETASPDPAAAPVAVWDPVVRITHWTIALLVILDLAVLEEGRWHERAGWAVLGLVALRLVWGVVGTRHARFSAFPPSLGAAAEHAREMLRGVHRTWLSHNPLGALMAYNLWASLIAVCLTGALMTTDAYWGSEWLEEVHEAFANWVLISVALHLAGVLFEQRRSKVGLIRAMLTGQKEIPGA